MGTSVDQVSKFSNDYEFWEKASIELDIAIDEQDEQMCEEIVKYPKDTLKNILRLEAKDEDRKKFWNLIIGKDGDVKIETKVRDRKPEDKFWTAFFLAKRVRAKLQSENTDTQLKKLDWVVDFLVKKAAAEISTDDTFKYLLLMLELAACTMGEQSLGFSEKARQILPTVKKEINDFCEWKFYAYKALIHYNNGVARQHMALYDSALKEYDKALMEYEKYKAHDIWLSYVYHPALLQKAETLIKMPFSYNALTTLERMENSTPPSKFHEARKNFLKADCYIELDDWHTFYVHLENEINTLDNFEKNSLVHKDKFLDARTPQVVTKERNLFWLLASSYNALVLEGAKKELKDKVDNILKPEPRKQGNSVEGLETMKIFDFLSDYMKQEQCKENRFERLTLEETILDYIKILVKLVKKEKSSFESKPDVVRVLIKKLRDILNDNKFIDEIDSVEKPLLKRGTINKAKNVMEEINDAFLKQWFHKKGGLPSDIKESFDFEKQLVDKLLNQKKRPDLIARQYDKTCLEVRQKLLEVIDPDSSCSFIKTKLDKNLVCVFGNNEIDENRNKCLEHVLEAIRLDPKPEHDIILQFTDYDNILRQEFQRFKKHVTNRSIQPLSEKGTGKDSPYSVNYVGLRRWNSYTPELSFSVGGGHFVFLSKNKSTNKNKGKVDIGIAVDPGFDFIRNFFRQGFTLTDIDIVLLTHGHPDHIRDFPAIVELLLENRKRGNEAGKMIYSIMSLGCYERLDDYIARDPFKLLFYDTIIVDIDKDDQEGGKINFSHKEEDDEKENKPVKLIPPNANPTGNQQINLCVEYFKSFHNDHSESDSYGYILTFKDTADKKKVSFGFTGDSKWFPKYAEKFKECDMICSHIGSIAETTSDKLLTTYDSIGKAERLIRTKNHPYLFGEILFLQDWKEAFKDNNRKALVLISEFGEEMKGKIRCDLVKRLNRPRNGKGCWSDIGPNVANPCKLLKHFTSLMSGKNCTKLYDCEKGANNIFTIPVDVGLRVSMPLVNEEKNKKKNGKDLLPGKVHCVICDEFVPPEKIDYEVYGHEEAIFYVCQTCLRSISIDVLHATYQKYHEKGREIEKDETSL